MAVGMYTDGIFKHLAKLQPSALIVVTFGDDHLQRFAVVDVRSLPEPEAATYLFQKRDSIPSQLNLITCGGTYNQTTHQYNDRIVVVAKLIGL